MKTVYISPDNIVIAVKAGDWTNNNPQRILIEDSEACSPNMIYAPDETPRFKLPPRPVFKPPAPRWTAFQFLLRFTEEEREAFRVAALTDGKVADFIQLCGAASEIESTHPMTVAGMAYLVSQDLLTQARADEVLRG